MRMVCRVRFGFGAGGIVDTEGVGEGANGWGKGMGSMLGLHDDRAGDAVGVDVVAARGLDGDLLHARRVVSDRL